MNHTVSLCICTMNRPEELERCLKSVEKSTVRPFEVVVSDDSRPDIAHRTRAVAERFTLARYVSGPRRGVAANRNNCVDEARGDLITFLDDDCLLDPQFLEKGLEVFSRHSRTTPNIILTGYVNNPDGPLYPSTINFLGFYMGRLPEGESPTAIGMACAIFPAAAFESIRFDEKISFEGEERDISLHALHKGFRIVYCPDMVVHHFPSSINRDLYKPNTITNRIYFGLKRYSVYERSLSKFLIFNVAILLNVVGHELKHKRPKGALLATGSFIRAWRIFLARP